MLYVIFRIHILINVIESRIDKIQYIYVGVCTKLHVNVKENGLYSVQNLLPQMQAVDQHETSIQLSEKKKTKIIVFYNKEISRMSKQYKEKKLTLWENNMQTIQQKHKRV